MIFLVLISGSLDTKRLHHSILLICEKGNRSRTGGRSLCALGSTPQPFQDPTRSHPHPTPGTHKDLCRDLGCRWARPLPSPVAGGNGRDGHRSVPLGQKSSTGSYSSRAESEKLERHLGWAGGTHSTPNEKAGQGFQQGGKISTREQRGDREAGRLGRALGKPSWDP